jgi:hypothetical protein
MVVVGSMGRHPLPMLMPQPGTRVMMQTDAMPATGLRATDRGWAVTEAAVGPPAMARMRREPEVAPAEPLTIVTVSPAAAVPAVQEGLEETEVRGWSTTTRRHRLGLPGRVENRANPASVVPVVAADSDHSP